MHPEKPPHGLPIYHRFMRFETLRSSKDTLLRRSEANLTSFFPCLSEAWRHAEGVFDWMRKRPVRGLGNPNKRAAISKRISPLIACATYRNVPITATIFCCQLKFESSICFLL